MPPITKLRSLQINPGNLWVGDGDPDTAMGGGDVHIEGTLEVDGALNLDGAIAFGNTLTVGESDTGYDVQFFGATADNYMLWDEDVDSLLVIGTAAKFRLGTFNADTTGYGSALSATNSAAFRVYTDDGGAAIGSGTLVRSGEFRNLQTYTTGNREQEAAGVVGKLVSVAGTNRHNMCGVMGSYEMKGTITVDGQIASTDTWVQAGVIGRVGMGTGTLGLSLYGVLAGVAAMSNIATAVSQTYTGEYCGFYVGAWAGTDDFEIGLLIEDSKTTTGIDIGAATTGINFSGDMTYGINMTDSLSATDAILIAGANADAIHISGANTVAGLHISGDQAIGILYDVDGSATDGLKFDIDTSMVLTRGIYFTGLGTATTAISIDVDGTTALSVGSVFSGVDMIVLNGTASGYGIEISGTCTTADLILQDGGLINDGASPTGGSGDALEITQDQILLTGKVEIGSPWGAAGAGAIAITGDGYDWAFQANAKVTTDISGTAVAGGYHSLAVTVTQTASTSVFGTWTELVFSNSVDYSAADNVAAQWAHLEGGTSVSAPATAGDFMAGIYTDVLMGTTFTTGADSVVNGVRVKGDIATGSISHAGRLAAFECLTGSSKQPWDYGLYVANSTTGIYINPTTCTGGIQIGEAANDATGGLTFATTAPVGFYFDDGGSATAAWGECFTVGLVLPTASTGGSQTGFPCATHVYTLQRANITGPANANMCALNASYIVSNSSTLDGFDNWCVSAFNPNLNVDSGSTVASGTTLAAIAFSGNWPGTISGRIVPMCVSTSNQDWSAFLELKEAAGSGCVQDAAAGANEKHLKVYLANTLYAITMYTA